MGWQIFVHAVRLVFTHLRPALRISGLLYFVPAIATLVISSSAVVGARDSRDVANSPLIWLMLLVTGIAALWIAVAWHRYVLMDEMPDSALPPFDGRRILAYFGYSLLIGVIIVGVGIVVFVPLGVLAAGMSNGHIGAALLSGVIITFIGYFIVAVVAYRLAPILPASAIDKPIKLGDAWAATRGAWGAILGLAFLSALCVVALEFGTTWVILNISRWAGIALSLVVSWVELIVGVSIITTLYGVYVEKRPIARG